MLAADKDDDDDDSTNATSSSTSPEAAGIVRGASRTLLQSLSKRKGFVRKTPYPTSRAMSELSTTKLLKTPLNSKNVAQVSDRMAIGVDLVTVAMEQQDHETNDPSSKRTFNNHKSTSTWPWKHYRESAMNITHNLIKNMVLGSIAFETYDHGIQYLETRTYQHSGLQHIHSETLISQHFLMGAFSGSIYSLSLMSWDGISHTLVTPKTITPPSPILFNLTSNAFSHAILYGSYEGFKRYLGGGQQTTEQHHGPTWMHVPIYGISGGSAGVLHHLCSHFMEGWRDNISFTLKDLRDIRFDTIKTLIPTGKSITFAFLSHAIGFVAFECGKEIMSDDGLE